VTSTIYRLLLVPYFEFLKFGLAFLP